MPSPRCPGSGPAYVFFLAEAMTAAAVELGLDLATATRMVNHTILGAATLLEASGEPAEVLRRNVTSPNGTTAAAIATMERARRAPGRRRRHDGRARPQPRAVRRLTMSERVGVVWDDRLAEYDFGPGPSPRARSACSWRCGWRPSSGSSRPVTSASSPRSSRSTTS